MNLEFGSSIDVKSVCATACMRSPLFSGDTACAQTCLKLGDNNAVKLELGFCNSQPMICFNEAAGNHCMKLYQGNDDGYLTVDSELIGTILTVTPDGKVGVRQPFPSATFEINGSSCVTGLSTSCIVCGTSCLRAPIAYASTCSYSPYICATTRAHAPIVVAGGLSAAHATATYQGKIDTTLNYQNYVLFKDEANTINFSIANGGTGDAFFPIFNGKVTSGKPALYFVGNSATLPPEANTGIITFDGRINNGTTGTSNVILANFVSGYGTSKAKIMADGTLCTIQAVCSPYICAGTCFIGSGAGLTGTASSLTTGGATNSTCFDGSTKGCFVYGCNGSGSNGASTTYTSGETAMYKSGFWETVGASWTPTTDWYWGLTAAHTSNGPTYNYSLQIAGNGTGSEGYYVRRINGGTPLTWKRIWTCGDTTICASTLCGSTNLCSPTTITSTVCATGTLEVCGANSCNIRLLTNSAYVLQGLVSSCTSLYYSGTEKLKTLSNGTCISGCAFATDYVLSSDMALKTNIEPISISPINIEYKQFNFKSDDERLRYGVIAQELRESNPELVSVGDDGLLNVSYTDLLIKEIAYLKCRVTELEKKIM